MEEYLPIKRQTLRGDEVNNYRKFGGCCYGSVFERYITKSKIKITTNFIPHTLFLLWKEGDFICVVSQDT